MPFKTHSTGGVLLALFIFLAISSPAQATNFSSAGLRLTKNIKPLSELKRQHVVTQSLDFSCGAAGLSTLLQYHFNDPVPEDQIILSLLNTVPLEKVRARRGFSLLDLKSFASAKGYDVTGLQMDINHLSELNQPVLVPIKFRNYRHFVVVRGVVDGRVFIADPAAGNMSMKIDQFQNIWSNGIALLIKNPKAAKAKQSRMSLAATDLLYVDYKMVNRLLNPSNLRTTIYPGEF